MAKPGDIVTIDIKDTDPGMDKLYDIFNYLVCPVINSVEDAPVDELSVTNGIIVTEPSLEEGVKSFSILYDHTIPVTALIGDTYKVILRPSGTSADLSVTGAIEIDYGVLAASGASQYQTNLSCACTCSI